MSQFTVEDIPKIALPQEPAAFDTPPQAGDPAMGIPQSSAAPDFMGETFGSNPWDDEEKANEEALGAWYRAGVENLDKAVLDPDTAFKDADLSFAADRDEARRLVINDSWLELNHDEPVAPDELQRRMQIQKVSLARFGEMVDSDEALFPLIQKDAVKRKDTRELGRDLTVAAYDDAMLPSDQAPGFGGFREKLKAHAGYDSEREADYLEAWHETRRDAKERVDAFREPLVTVWRAFKMDGNITAAAMDAYAKLTPEQRPEFMDALAIRAKALPVEERKTFWQNMGKVTGQAVSDYGRNAAESMTSNVQKGGTVGWEDFLGSNEAVAARNASDAKTREDFQLRRNFAADVRKVAREDYDPLKSAFGEGKPGFWEGVAYQAPGVTATSLTMAVPYVGMATMALSMEGSAYEQMRGRMLAAGKTDEESTGIAEGLAPFIAAPQVALEKIGFGLWSRKMPGLSKAIDSIGDQITNRLLRGAVKTGTIGTAETAIELAQDSLVYTVQDIAAGLSEDIPDVDWGKELSGTWASAPEIFFTMLPLSILGAAGGLSAESRHAAFSRATTTELQALGINTEGISAINAANGPSSLASAVDSAMASRDPNSEEAIAAVGALKLQLETQRQARSQLDELGYSAPSFVQSPEGITVFDGEGKELGSAPDLSGAVRIARANTVALDDMQADQVAVLGSLMESARAAVELDPSSTVEVNLGEFDPSQATPEMAARFAAQVALKEQAEGGTGDIARSVLGYSVTEMAQGVRQTVNRLFKGAAVTDVFHETFHGLRRQARAAGTITKPDEIAMLRALDTVLAGKTTKDGTQLRFIPDQMTDEQVSDTLLDEAFSEIAEMEILRTRKGQGKGKLGLTRGVISRNLTALTKLMPGTIGKWTAFMQAVRARWGLSLSRALAMKKAERDGTFDKTGYDAYLDKVLGLDQQVEHDAGVQDEFARMMGGQEVEMSDDIPFSIGSITPFESFGDGDLQPVANRQEAEALYADGRALYAVNEMDDGVEPITSMEMLNGYPSDAIFVGDAAVMGNTGTAFSIGRSAVEPTAETRIFQGDGQSPTVIGPASFSIGAFHGTPHNVDRFSNDKIGTGEGAQAFGYGLYFSESRELAKVYQKTLSGGEYVPDESLRKFFAPGRLVPSYSGFDRVISFDWRGQGDWSVTVQSVDEKGNAKDGERPRSHFTLPDVKAVKEAGLPVAVAGNLYSVSLDVKEEDLLDYDKPMMAQSDKVKAALGIDEAELAALAAELKSIEAKIDPATFDGSGLQSEIGAIERKLNRWNIGVRDYYEQLAKSNRGETPGTRAIGGQASAMASKWLLDQGIQGVRYLDGASRDGGSGSYNYVIFDDSKIKITEENGKPVDLGEVAFSLGGVGANYSPETSFSIGSVHPELKTTAPGDALPQDLKLAPVADSTSSANINRQFENLDAIFEALPNPLATPSSWVTFMRAIGNSLGKKTAVPIAPERAIGYANGQGFDHIMVDLKAHPEYVAARVQGLEVGTRILSGFRNGSLKRADLGSLFIWGLLSRGIGAYPQEGAFSAIHRAGLIDQLERVFAGEMTPVELRDWALTAAKGSPMGGAFRNVKAIDQMVTAMMFEIDKKPAIDHLLELWKRDLSGPQLRREVYRMFTNDRPSIQIQNKVLSFIILVSGRPDVMVLDRVQFRHLWGGSTLDGIIEALSGKLQTAKDATLKLRDITKGSAKEKATQDVNTDASNTYDALPVVVSKEEEDRTIEGEAELKAFGQYWAVVLNFARGKRAGTFDFQKVAGKLKVKRTGLVGLGNGLHGLATYEAIERAMADQVAKAYQDAGIEYPGVGAFHWDSWLVSSRQAISHPTLDLIAGNKAPGLSVMEGKFNTINYGMLFRYDGQYMRESLTVPGRYIMLTPEAAAKDFTTAAVNKAIGRKGKNKLKLKNSEEAAEDEDGPQERTRPWTEDLTDAERLAFDQWLDTIGTAVQPDPANGTDGRPDGGRDAGLDDVQDGAVDSSLEEVGPAFSIGPARVAGILSDNALSRITDPRRRTHVMSRIARDFNAMRLQIERITALSGIRRSKGDLRREAMAREDLAAEEKIGLIHQRFGSLLADEDLVKIKQQPVNSYLATTRADGKLDPFRGRLKSKAQAIKDSPDLFQLHRVGDYDGSDGVSRSVFGGTLMPDQAAQELFDNHLISEPTADAMWEALMVEQNTVAKFKEMLVQAQEQIRAAKLEAKQEANEWLATQGKDQEVNFSDKEEIRRSLRMLDAILLALPAEIRGKIGGYTQISMIATDEARLAYLKDKLSKADKELETYLRVEYAKEWEALLAKAAPKTNEAGQRPTGSIAADAYDILRIAEAAMGINFAEGEAEADKWDAIADHPDTEEKDIDLARVKAQMIRLTMNWNSADAARREQAVLEGDKIYFDGLRGLAIENSRRRERLGKLRTSAIKGTGKTGSRMEREATRQAAASKGGEFKSMVWEFLSFGQLVNVLFGEKSDAGKWFNAREIAASNAAYDGFQAKANSLESLFDTLSGNRFDGEKLRHRMATAPTIKVKDALGVDHTFTDSQAVTFLLMWRQEDGKRHMEGLVDEETGAIISTWGWNDDAAASIESQLSREGQAVMAFLGSSYGEEYGRINEVFRRIWNVSMPRHKMYAPLSVNPVQGKGDSIMDPVSGDAMGAGMTPGSLKNRSFSAIAEPEFKDAFQVYLQHARQMEHFIAYGEFSRDALGVINRRETRGAILAAGGPAASATLSKWVDYFALGGLHDANMGSAWTKVLGGMLGRISQAALVGRVSVLCMQSLQLGAAAFKMPVGSFLTRIAKLTTGQLGWGDAIRSEYIQRRMDQMPPVVRDMMAGMASGTPNRAKYLATMAGRSITGADGLFTAGTYAIFYDYHLKLARQAKDATPEATAHREAERLTDQVAQPTRTGARSWLEVANQGNPAFRAAWNFSSDPRQKMSLFVYEAMRRDVSGGEKAMAGGKSFGLVWIVGGVLATLLRTIIRDLRNDDDDEIFDERYWNPYRLGLMAAMGPLGGVPFLGGMLEDSTYKATGQFMPRGGMLGFLADGAALPRKWSNGKIDPLKDLETLATAGAGFSGTSAAAASAMHLIRDLVGLAENLEGPE